MSERPGRKFLGVTTSAAIAAGSLLVPAVKASQNEHDAIQTVQKSAVVRIGGYAVRSSATAAQTSYYKTKETGLNGGTPDNGREVIGCTSRRGSIIKSGSVSKSKRQVALTFDDGPSVKYTPKILNILNRYSVHATFFEEGKHVHGREGLMAAILASGSEIGNHSYHHPEYPGYGELRSTNRRIEEATGFRPCLFRPPYGLVDGSVSSAADRLGLELVEWDVDSLDDKHPGVSAIRSNVLSQAEPGSVILMHDGGHHPQTVKALPGIIRGLHDRGLGFATVTELTGGHFIYANQEHQK